MPTAAGFVPIGGAAALLHAARYSCIGLFSNMLQWVAMHNWALLRHCLRGTHCNVLPHGCMSVPKAATQSGIGYHVGCSKAR